MKIAHRLTGLLSVYCFLWLDSCLKSYAPIIQAYVGLGFDGINSQNDFNAYDVGKQYWDTIAAVTTGLQGTFRIDDTMECMPFAHFQ